MLKAIEVDGHAYEVSTASYDATLYGPRINNLLWDIGNTPSNNPDAYLNIDEEGKFVRLVSGSFLRAGKVGDLTELETMQGFGQLTGNGFRAYLESIDSAQKEIVSSVGATVVPHEWLFIRYEPPEYIPYILQQTVDYNKILRYLFDIPEGYFLGARVPFVGNADALNDYRTQKETRVSKLLDGEYFEGIFEKALVAAKAAFWLNGGDERTLWMPDDIEYPRQYHVTGPLPYNNPKTVAQVAHLGPVLLDFEPRVRIFG